LIRNLANALVLLDLLYLVLQDVLLLGMSLRRNFVFCLLLRLLGLPAAKLWLAGCALSLSQSKCVIYSYTLIIILNILVIIEPTFSFYLQTLLFIIKSFSRRKLESLLFWARPQSSTPAAVQ
jgi:hypothetical protein